MTVKEFRQAAALKRQNEREGRALLESCWPVVPHVCAYCGFHVKHDDASAHHLNPRAWGGSDRPANLVLVHKKTCHDAIEAWTEAKRRPPTFEERGRLARTTNLVVDGIGTAKQDRPAVANEPPLTTDDPARYMAYLRKLDVLYQAKIADDPLWGMWACGPDGYQLWSASRIADSQPPRVEPVRVNHTMLSWEATPCLCSCHYGQPACDDRQCERS